MIKPTKGNLVVKALEEKTTFGIKVDGPRGVRRGSIRAAHELDLFHTGRVVFFDEYKALRVRHDEEDLMFIKVEDILGLDE